MHTSRVDNSMMVHTSTIDSTGFDNCIRMQLVWIRYLSFFIQGGLLGKPKVILGDIGYPPTRRTSI